MNNRSSWLHLKSPGIPGANMVSKVLVEMDLRWGSRLAEDQYSRLNICVPLPNHVKSFCIWRWDLREVLRS